MSRHARAEEHDGADGADHDDGWSAPSLYGRGLLTIEPRTYTEAEPVPAVPLPVWQQTAAWESTGEAEHWGPVTYVGRPRRRGDTATAEPTAADATAGSQVDQPQIEPAPGGETDQALAVPAQDATQDAARDPAQAAPAEDNRRLLASSRTMAIASLASRITGFLRSVALAAALGVGLVGDAYNGANSFPNMVYELLLGGVLSSVLIPLLVHAQEHDRDGGEAYTHRLLSVATAALGAATVLAVAAAPLLARAFVSDHAQEGLTATFARLLLPEIFFYGVGAMFTAVLNTRGVYGPGAWAPVLNNVITLLTVAVFLALPGPKTLTPSTITSAQVYVVGIGTTLGIVGQAVVLWPYLRRVGFRWRWRFTGTGEDAGRLREAGTLTGWVLGYVVASQVGVTVITKIAFGHRGVSKFTYADLLFQVPYGILGVSLLTALMPRLSRAAARGDDAGVLADFGLGARLSAMALVPVTFGLLALGPDLCVVLFAHGATPIADARLIGDALALASFGLLPFALVMLQLRVFYAVKDARTPTLINIGMVGTKVVLVLLSAALLHGSAVVIALNVSTSLSYVVGALLGHVLLTRRFGRLGFRAVGTTVTRIAGVSLAGGVVAYLVVLGIGAALGSGRAGALTGLVVGAVAGLAVLVALVVRLKLPEVGELRSAIRR